MEEELTITGVEETPFSQGETLASLWEKAINYSDEYNSLRLFHYGLIGAAGACSIFCSVFSMAGAEAQDKLGVFLSSTGFLSLLSIGGLFALMPREYDWEINGHRENVVTSFEAYKKMPLFLELGFAFRIFEKNAVFVVE